MSKPSFSRYAVTNKAPGPRFVHAINEDEVDLPEPASTPVRIEPEETLELLLTDIEKNSAASRSFEPYPGQKVKEFEFKPVKSKAAADGSGAPEVKPLASEPITKLRKIAKDEGVDLGADDTTAELIAAKIEEARAAKAGQ